MIDLEKSKGIGVFGPEYRVLMENDSHAPCSVDRDLVKEMILLSEESVEYLYNDYTPLTIQYRKETRPKLELCIKDITKSAGNKKIIEAIAEFTCSSLLERAEQDLDKITFGGLEEDIIGRGSDFCGELARVGCVLCQISGIPARIVALADIDEAYTGHFIIEAFFEKVWGAIDTTTNVVYRHQDGSPASTWDLMKDHFLIESHWRDETTQFTNPGQFKAAAITNYFVWDRLSYNYSTSSVNEYYRLILEMSNKGWPGGVRWLHEEERAQSK